MHKTMKDLENLYSWSQFYQNSHQLAVSRYPRRYKQEINPSNGVKISVMEIPYTDSIRFLKAQLDIADLEKKLFRDKN
jgi:predicted adenine nucleotide alpha hydrolase (AANH) superfamily ATPase